jgi:hypothetical protein
MTTIREDLVSGFRDGWRDSGRVMRRRRFIPAAAVLVGGAIAIYALVRLGG